MLPLFMSIAMVEGRFDKAADWSKTGNTRSTLLLLFARPLYGRPVILLVGWYNLLRMGLFRDLEAFFFLLSSDDRELMPV